MGDSRNFTALDWVTGEINETLTQARQALETYVSNPDDPTQIRFCLTYLHQVHGILQMVEFYGGALLAEELEQLGQALVDGEVANEADAHEVLMRAILQLPVYLEHVKASRQDDPGSLLPLLNDLRAVRGGALLTETALFSPDMSPLQNISGKRLNISAEKFTEAVKKLRQLYQMTLVDIINQKDFDSNLPKLEKVFTNFEKVSQGTAYKPFWDVCLALVEGLHNDSISASVAINNLLREIEKVIKRLSADGIAALDNFESEELVKNLLYYIAGSDADSPRVSETRNLYKLEDALPQGGEEEQSDDFLAGAEPDAMRSVVQALGEEFGKVKEVFDSYVSGQQNDNEALSKILPVFKQAADTLAVLGQGALRKTIEALADSLEAKINETDVATGNDLMDIAANLLEVEGTLNSQFNKDAERTDDAPPSMDIAMLTAQETVLFESQNALEQAKDAVVEYIASQWERRHIEPLPDLLMEIRGGLEMVNQRRSARILGACARYIKDKLIDGGHEPDWKEMDTLADAIAGVEYYLETLDEDVIEEEDTILGVAEDSVSDLGYAVKAFKREDEAGDLDDDVPELDDTPSDEELEEIQSQGTSPLTAEKLAAIMSDGEEPEPEEVEEEDVVEVDKEESKPLIEIPEDGPLLSDEEFDSIETKTDGLELETEFSFDGLAETGIEAPTAVEEAAVEEPASDSEDATLEVESELEVEEPEETLELEPVEDAAEIAEPEPIEEVSLEVEEPVELESAEIIDLPVTGTEEPESEPEFEEAEAEVAQAEEAPAVAAVEAEDDEDFIFDNFEDEDFDDEIAEIFIEEIEEVLENIGEFYPKWKESSYQDDDALTEFRRGFHTMKGSGRMAKAVSVGELAWAVENMLNRVIDQTIEVSDNVIGLIDRVLDKVPSMMAAFANKQPDPDPALSKRYRLIGEALSMGNEPLPFELDMAVVGVAEEAAPTEDLVAAEEVVEEAAVAEEVAEDAGIEIEEVSVEEFEEAAAEAVEDEIDWDLWDIFAGEAESHLEVADEWIEYARGQHPMPADPSDPLQRALHTLKGSAYMAEINSIAELATPLEKFVKALRAFQIQVTESFTDLLESCVKEIRVGLAQIEDRTTVVLDNKDSLLISINAMRLELTGESEEDIVAETGVRPSVSTPEGAAVDPTMFNEFLASEMDALMDADIIVADWQTQPDDLSGVEKLVDELHKMAEAAEPAGLMPIASMCRLLLQGYGKVLDANGRGRDVYAPLATTAHETLINFIDELAGGQDLANNAEVEAQLQGFIDTELPAEVAEATTTIEDALEDTNQTAVREALDVEALEAAAEGGAEPASVEDLLEDANQTAVREVVDVDTVESEAEVEEAPAVAAEMVSLDDFDGDLLEIFVEEAEELLEELDEIVAEWSDDRSESSHPDRLKRNLHTYKGGARMAGLSVLGTLAHDLETQLETFSGTADQTLIDEVHDYQDRLIKGTERVRSLLGGESVAFADLEMGAVVAEPAAEPEVEEASLDVAEVEETVEVAEEVVEPVVEDAVEETVEEVAEAAATPAAGVLEMSDDIDAELLEIFIDEANELVEELDHTIAEWEGEPETSQVDELKRILHTLKGGARMAGLTGLGSIAHDLETYLETFTGSGDAELFSMLHDYQDRIIAGVDQAKAVAAGEQPTPMEAADAPPETEEVEVAEIAEAEVEEVAPVAAGFAIDIPSDLDMDLLEIFLDEASELLEELDNAIHGWQGEPDNRDFCDELKRVLHTFKGGARMAGIMQLGDLAHDLETQLETHTGAASPELLQEILDYQDKIVSGVEQVRGFDPNAPQVESPAEATVEEEPTPDVPAPVVADGGAEILPFKAANTPTGLDKKTDKAAAEKAKAAGPQEMVKVAAELIEELVNLAGETSISRGRVEQQVTDFGFTLDDVDATIGRLQDQLRRLEIETEAQVQSKIEEIQARRDDFDPLEMDRYSTLQQLTRSLMETSSDLLDLRAQLTNKARETEMVLLQQSRINTELQEGLMRSRMVPFSRMVPRLRRIVRQVSGELKKEVDFDLENVEGEMDRTVLERMVAPLEHMLRNALDHGIEMPADREKAGKSRRGKVILSFGREGGDVLITLRDDGGGIPVEVIRQKAIERGLMTEETHLSDQEILQFIMQAGFSTAEKVTQISGRGVGMDVVHSEIKQLGGTMQINSQLGAGTEFTVRLPFTVSVNRALMVKIGDDQFAVPLNSIEGIVRVSPFELENYYSDPEARFEYAGELYEVRYLGALLQTKLRPNLEGLTLPEAVILVRGADHSIALHVDQLLGSREIVVKSLGPQFGAVPGLSGATILGDGSVVVILDPMALVRSAVLLENQGVMVQLEQQQKAAAQDVFTVMVVDDSVTVRKVTSRFLEREGFEVILAKDGADAMLQLQDHQPDVMLLDIEMPRMDGFEVASSVKNTDRLKEIPIIMITSRTGDKHRERAMSLGVERYMGKPFVEDELLETINELVAQKLRQSALAE